MHICSFIKNRVKGSNGEIVRCPSCNLRYKWSDKHGIWVWIG